MKRAKSSRYSGTSQVRFVNLHSSPWHPVLWVQNMSSDFKCSLLVKRLFTLAHAHTHAQMHARPHTRRPTWHADLILASCKALHLMGGQSLHTESPHTIKSNSKGWEKLHTRHHTSFNPRCLRESEGNGEAEHNSWTWTTRNGICVGLSAPQREVQGKRTTTGWRTKEKA